jgi:hypothetical protein
MQKYFRLAEGVSEVEASTIFNKIARKVINYHYVLRAGVEAANEAHTGVEHLSNQGPTPYYDG